MIEEEIEGHLNGKKIDFIHENMKHQIDLEKKIFIRENEDYSFYLDIEHQKCEIQLKNEQNTLQVNVNYAIILQNKNEIEISYLIETQEEIIHLRLVMLGG